MAKTDEFAFLESRGRLLSVAVTTGLLAFLSTASPPTADAATVTAQGAVTALTNVSEMGLTPAEARFDEPGVSAGDPIPVGLYSGVGLTFRVTNFATIGIQDRSGTPGSPQYLDPSDHFPLPIGGGASQTGLGCRTCGVASVTGSRTRIGLTASRNGTQYLTVWDTGGYIIGQVTWDPLNDAAFVGLDTGGVPIGFVAYGNDDVWNGATYEISGSSTYTDTWLLQALCGNNVVDAGEQCDDGNQYDGDCCNAGCEYEAADSLCDADANACTIDQCDGLGTCLFSSNLDCVDTNPCTQDSCLAASGCVNAQTPATGCGSAGVASLMLSNSATAAKKKATFVWAKGTSGLAAFGDIATTDYSLCVYDAGGIVANMTAPAASTCAGIDCWKMLGTAGNEKGVAYKDKSRIPEHDGVKTLIGKADDGTAGKASVKLVALGENIPAMATGSGLSGTVTAQVVTNNAACWDAQFPSATKNDGVLYKAKFKAP
ncbi:MAG: hypothetical protein HY899_01510 [Deltaproteobacteria bacterium]|nr:hypothetical protein [Deltaproteobacteria bacterium]